jgi:hypothetical protein
MIEWENKPSHATVTVTPHQSLKLCSYDDLKNMQPLIRIYHEKN